MDLLPIAQSALNGRPTSSIGGIIPFFLQNRYELDPLMEPTPQITDKSWHPGKTNTLSYVKKLKDTQDFAQAAMAAAQQRGESNANKDPRQPERFLVWDKVWLELRNIKTPLISKKLAWQHAKYEVTVVLDDLSVN